MLTERQKQGLADIQGPKTERRFNKYGKKE
jgi:hypothetical protein